MTHTRLAQTLSHSLSSPLSCLKEQRNPLLSTILVKIPKNPAATQQSFVPIPTAQKCITAQLDWEQGTPSAVTGCAIDSGCEPVERSTKGKETGNGEQDKSEP